MEIRGVQPGKTEPIKTEHNQKKKSVLDLIVLNKSNGCYF